MIFRWVIPGHRKVIMETWIKMASELLGLHLRTKPLFDWLRPRPRTWCPFSLCLISTHSRFGSTTNCRLPSSGSFAGIAAVPSVAEPQCHRKLITNLREITPPGNCCGFVQINPHICKSWSFLQRFNQCFFTVYQLFSLQNCDRSFFSSSKLRPPIFFLQNCDHLFSSPQNCDHFFVLQDCDY